MRYKNDFAGFVKWCRRNPFNEDSRAFAYHQKGDLFLELSLNADPSGEEHVFYSIRTYADGSFTFPETNGINDEEFALLNFKDEIESFANEHGAHLQWIRASAKGKR